MHSITNVFPNYRVVASLAGNDGLRRYARLSGYTPSSELICLPVSKSLSRAESLLAKLEQGGGTSYVDDPVTLAREVLELCLPPGYLKRSVAFTFLVTHLVIRYERLGGIRDLDETLVRVLNRGALEFGLRGHLARTMFLNRLAACLSARYEQLGPTQDLDTAIVLGREALELCLVSRHPNHSASLSDLVACPFTRLNQLGAMIDLDAAVVLKQDALELRPQGQPGHSMSLDDLAVDHSTRYNQLRAMHPKGAIVLDQEALDLWPEGHPDRSLSLNNLADALSTWYR